MLKKDFKLVGTSENVFTKPNSPPKTSVKLEFVNTRIEIHAHTHIHDHMILMPGCYRGAELIEASTVKAVRARLEVEKTSMDLLKRQ